MKAILLILSVILSSCSCVLPQIVPQFIYAGQDCTAPIPDYVDLVKGTDNCKLSWMVQDPAPGWLLTPDNMSMMVTIRIGDVSGNIRETSFSVTLLDTIKPTFIIDPSLLVTAWETIDKIYNYADEAVKQMVFYDQILNVDAPFIPDQVGASYFSGVERKTYPVLNPIESTGGMSWSYDGVAQVDSSFLNKTLVIRSPYNNKRTFAFE